MNEQGVCPVKVLGLYTGNFSICCNSNKVIRSHRELTAFSHCVEIGYGTTKKWIFFVLATTRIANSFIRTKSHLKQIIQLAKGMEIRSPHCQSHFPFFQTYKASNALFLMTKQDTGLWVEVKCNFIKNLDF